MDAWTQTRRQIVIQYIWKAAPLCRLRRPCSSRRVPLLLLYYTHTHTHTILYHTIVYYAILYYTILYYTILYYTILHYNLPRLCNTSCAQKTPARARRAPCKKELSATRSRGASPAPLRKARPLCYLWQLTGTISYYLFMNIKLS